ncbi:CDP-glycerol glycerophosphotransferase family protein [Aeromicrobium choanae]|uniref:CDP-glycerol glycerophosphotransferase, TagB/SpsB family n=1 Tax=Aeromicrobium choanae TaxID=1736691 RepID=A0A1T4YXT7_9ACTN|nr:CDP-glycerol glycerophosphotransferase family protein [Aeromicrobium choanae]SKB06463.1 CDP-glycerol glycerophosphotransferase, TagB/SpsB family [Aeromicrobium choanae]
MSLGAFVDTWRAFAAAWDAARGTDDSRAQAMLDHVLAEGLPELADPDRASDEVVLACEIALVKSARALDVKAYRAIFPASKSVQRAPYKHFCTSGWKQLINPRIDFDAWWYWSEHLDPTRDDVNPLVHHLAAGQHACLPTLPPASELRPPTSFEPDEPVRRVCLFAGYDPDGIIDDYVVDYVTELSRHADVYFLTDATVSPGELEKLSAVTSGAWAIRHGRYDFGSWSLLARDLVGWDVLETYDEVLFANDSAYLLRPLDEVFATMSARSADWWGIHATKRPYSRDSGDEAPLPLVEAKRRWRAANAIDPIDHLHLSSYFLAFRRPVIADEGFRRRLDAVTTERSKSLVIVKYEVGLSRYLLTRGFDVDTYVDGLYPYLPVYTSDYWSLVEQGFPLLKRNLITENPRRMPGLATWKHQISQRVPSAKVDLYEHNLLRVSADDHLQRSLSVEARSDGTIDYQDPLSWPRLRQEDEGTPTYDHWWAFPVCAYDHTLGGNERAVFEYVRDDPSIKKVILTRSRRVDLAGENVVVVPLMSRAGQEHLIRSRQIFVKHGPQINGHWPVSPLTHNFINLWHGIPLKRFGSASTAVTRDLERTFLRNNGGSRAVIASSRMDQLAMTSAFWPLSYTEIWNTGLPRNDFVTCDADRLPPDLRETEQRLRGEVGDRRLVMFLPTFKDAQAEAYYRFTDADLERLADWMDRHGAVLGVREHMADQAGTYWHQLAPLGSLDLSSRRYPDLEVLYRVASGLISDYSSCLVDFMLTGRPLASFAYDLDHYANRERGLFYDLERVLPGPVCRDFDELAAALDGFFDEPDPTMAEEHAWRRRIFHDHADAGSAARVVGRVKSLYD